jgi:ATP-dependent Clp protease ATP-binding subunit ClpC
VAEPSLEETVQVLKGVRASYENFHRVKITDEAIEAAVRLSERYVPEKFLPDKAIDLLDEAASHLKTSQAPSEHLTAERGLSERLRQLIEAKELAIKEENFPLANAYKEEEAKVKTDLERLRKGTTDGAQTLGTVGPDQIAQVVAQVTGVAVTELMAPERERLQQLETLLSARVVGQTEAIAQVAKAIRRGRLGLGNPARPLGSFVFLGPSGVGKTELAKAVAETVFSDPSALIRLDMSEFSEGFNISKLIGAPAGYVGYKDSNKLTDLIKRKPASVVLFDEVEKAHPDVFNLLLQILEDGHLTDAAGKQVNFKNSLIIMTSNLGLQELKNQARLGFELAGEGKGQFQESFAELKDRLMGEVKKFFRPEFLNRLDGVLIFNPLSETNLEEIVKLQLNDLNQRLKAQKLALTISLGRGAAAAVAKKTFSPDEGARGIRRFLQEHVEDPITQKLLHLTKVPAKVTIKVTKEGVVTLE